MSHTTYLPDNWTAIHNGDYSGPINFFKVNAKGEVEKECHIPFEVVAALVANRVRNDRIAELEDMNTDAILGLIR